MIEEPIKNVLLLKHNNTVHPVNLKFSNISMLSRKHEHRNTAILEFIL